MQSTEEKKQKGFKKACKCHCCLNPIPSFPNSFDHQNSANITNSSTLHYDFATAATSSLYPHIQFTDPDSLPTLQESFRSFNRAFPQYFATVEADQIRADYYPHLPINSPVCLDYTGHALFSFSQQQEQQQKGEFVASSSTADHSKITQFEISHKSKELSTLETGFEAKLGARIMSFFNISEDEYTIFFTANQTSAFRVISQCYPFQSNRKNLLTVYDHENEAIEAMVETSRNRGARVSSAEFKWPKMKIHCAKLEEMLLGSNKKINNNSKKKKKDKGLFVFPLQSRVCGARYSYQWMNLAQQNGWHVLLDATGLGPKDMDTLGLSLFRPDFLISTFYKVFGHDPSGFSCLFVRKSIIPILKDLKPSSPTEIVSIIGVNSLHAELEQSSNVPCKALDHADTLGLVLIGTRIRCLSNWLVNALLALSHPHSEKGIQLVTIYGSRVRFDRGPTLAFNVFDWKGEKIDPLLVQKLADRYNISLGYGFIKHLWFSERYKEDKGKLLENTSREREVKSKGKGSEKNDCGIAVVTANLGFLTNFEDLYRVWVFVARFLDADFVEKERWRYTALNQRTYEV